MNYQPTQSEQERKPIISDTARRYIFLSVSILSIILAFTLFFSKFYSYSYQTPEAEGSSVLKTVKEVVRAFHGLSGTHGVVPLVTLLCIFGFFAGSVAFFIKSIRSFSAGVEKYGRAVENLLVFNSVGTGVFFAASVIYCVARNSASIRRSTYTPGTFVPFLLSLVLFVVFAFLMRGAAENVRKKKGDGTLLYRIELLAYSSAVAVLSIIAALTNILTVSFTKPDGIEDIVINGADILTTYPTLGEGFQLVAFAVVAILRVMGALLVASIASFVTRSDFFYRISVTEMLFGTVFSLALALFGKYYEIVQKLNENGIAEWLEDLVTVSVSYAPEYEVDSSTFIFFIAIVLVAIAALIRKPYTKAQARELAIASPKEKPTMRTESVPKPAAPAAVSAQSTLVADPCPAFTELDFKRPLFASELAEAKESGVTTVTLPALVQYVVNYARDSRLHLFYTAEDIATFIAGLGATRLTILQGMSGTGKTSLPKIFTEAIYGRCDIVEIESSWRDKNELLGYYNEFSRTYTPKKFTQALYRAALNPETVTFIVLDEMNLSRIEYYFSDFLSLMENEEDKREIKLLNVGLFRTDADGERTAYAALTDGHTLKIPSNVWFIGTANRDESTFEISDKVYDRAHTMNFNKRAARVSIHSDPLPRRYISTEQLAELLENARGAAQIDVANDPLVQEVEAILAPYNISFGNRIAKQIEAFVNIYCACFAPSPSVRHDAIEAILLSKVVSKLEQKSIEDKEELAAEFAKRGLHRCSAFILKLSED